MKKLVIFKSEEEYRAQSGSWPNLVNFNFAKRSGEFDDGCGNTGHVDFAVSKNDSDTARIDGIHYDSVELVGLGLPSGTV